MREFSAIKPGVKRIQDSRIHDTLGESGARFVGSARSITRLHVHAMPLTTAPSDTILVQPMIRRTSIRSVGTTALSVFALLALPRVARAADEAAKPLEALPEPESPKAVSPAHQPATTEVAASQAPIEPAAPLGKDLAIAQTRWEARRASNFSKGMTTAAIAYGVSASIGAAALGLNGGSRNNGVTGWAAPMFIPVVGPMYIGARMIVEYTIEMGKSKGDFAGLALMFAPIVYLAGLGAIVDGVIQGVGLGLAAGLDEGAPPTANHAQRAQAPIVVKSVAKSAPKQVGVQKLWVLPAASERQVGVQMGGAF
jgi:hypothetical protein